MHSMEYFESLLTGRRQPKFTWLSIVVGVIACCVIATKWLRRQGNLVGHNGTVIPEIQGESRFSRFNQGLAARNSPCLVWNGDRPDIILTQPEHVKEFCSRKAKSKHLRKQKCPYPHIPFKLASC
ncbi:Cytochrome P450 [Apiospora rasikravindrae]|uniref:Cytochrome P450 n=1 Tax=Apiospora rasikravindrae TaxID=990691 RepID=A0ABR1T0U5_9PEZI